MEKFDTLIEQYLSGELQGAERRQFEERLQEDEALQKQMALYETVEGTLQEHFRGLEEKQDLLGQLQSISGEFFQEEKKSEPKGRVVTLRRTLAFAAAIAAAVILLIWAPWQASLYEQYAIHPAAAFTRMSGGAGELSRAEQAFNNKDYATAALQLEAFLEGEPDDTEARYFLGISYLETGQYDKADRLFRQLLEGNSAYTYEGAWYLALSFLRQGNTTATREYLERIPEGSDRYGKAQELLGKLGG